MAVLEKGNESAKTVTFPNTVRKVLDGSFRNMPLKSAVLNEGLQVLGGLKGEDGNNHRGVFSNSQIRDITFPSTLRVFGDETFNSCKYLSRVASRQKASVEADGTRLAELCHGDVVLPAALEKVGPYVFNSCSEIKVIYIENRSIIDSLREYNSVTAILPAETMVGDRFLRNLRRQKDVVIPDGYREIGTEWFMNSGIESVTVPASVRKI